jgi:hypothetical protein
VDALQIIKPLYPILDLANFSERRAREARSGERSLVKYRRQ